MDLSRFFHFTILYQWTLGKHDGGVESFYPVQVFRAGGLVFVVDLIFMLRMFHVAFRAGVCVECIHKQGVRETVIYGE